MSPKQEEANKTRGGNWLLMPHTGYVKSITCFSSYVKSITCFSRMAHCTLFVANFQLSVN